MTPLEMIYRRKSVRSYADRPVDAATLAKIRGMMADLRPLIPGIPVRGEIVARDRVKCILPWIAPQAIAIFTDDTPGALENAGFMFQQLELQLQCMGLGACWLGMGKLSARGMAENTRDDGMKCIMMLTFGYPKGDMPRSGPAEFKRKAMAEISDCADERLEPARLAPSSVNSQPWRFTHDGETIHVHCAQGFMKMLSDMNRIDMGIALAHLYLSRPAGFRFFRQDGIQSPRGCAYTGSLNL